ncbi:MAG: hypothetical protein OHK0019_37860 [Saprospiraceae bacterium]
MRKSREQIDNVVKRTRLYRQLHRWIAIFALWFMFLIGFTGLLLGWKKHSGLLPPTQKGKNTDGAAWISIDSLQRIAQRYSQDSLQKPTEIDRIDIRPAKGTAKMVFAEHFTELQLDCTTGEILSVRQRNSDIIEKIHDASILDFLFKTSNEQLKLSYTTLASVSLMLLSLSGFWLWYNPKRIRKYKAAPTE